MKSHSPTVFQHEAFLSALLLRMQPRVVMEGDSMQLMNAAKNRAIHIMNSSWSYTSTPAAMPRS